MKIAFMGTPDFAVPSLRALIAAGHSIEVVVTQPDRPKGRGGEVAMSAVKEYAIEEGIKVMQPEKIKKDEETIEYLKSLDLDFFVVIAYGQILNKEILDIPKKGCINVHGSLLPEYRGAAPIQWAIVDGKDETGVTTMLMDEGMDTGDMLLKRSIAILSTDTAGTLHEKLSMLGADAIVSTIESFDKIIPEKQNEELVTYAKIIDKKMGLINWDQNSKEIVDLVRGFAPWPSAYTYLNNKMFKVWGAREYTFDNKRGVVPGQIVYVDNNEGIVIKTKNGHVMITDMQMQGKKRMETKEYLRGNTFEIGTVLGINKN
ncbi:MAG: methionyl-tRNA formyltransferase [Clostridia bacterium]|jgi:methionyl-tRNA formyltransferase|nr:methionyl-tRNA formyltransferase [Clostridia bacterium]